MEFEQCHYHFKADNLSFSLQNSEGDVTVTVTQSSTTLTHSSYTYDDGLTATVSSVSPTTIGVSG